MNNYRRQLHTPQSPPTAPYTYSPFTPTRVKNATDQRHQHSTVEGLPARHYSTIVNWALITAVHATVQ